MMTRAILFLLAMMTGLTAAQAADRSRARPDQVSSAIVAALSAKSGAATVAVRAHHAPLVNALIHADLTAQTATLCPLAQTKVHTGFRRLRPDVAHE